jgi:hypothetical protein
MPTRNRALIALIAILALLCGAWLATSIASREDAEVAGEPAFVPDATRAASTMSADVERTAVESADHAPGISAATASRARQAELLELFGGRGMSPQDLTRLDLRNAELLALADAVRAARVTCSELREAIDALDASDSRAPAMCIALAWALEMSDDDRRWLLEKALALPSSEDGSGYAISARALGSIQALRLSASSDELQDVVLHFVGASIEDLQAAYIHMQGFAGRSTRATLVALDGVESLEGDGWNELMTHALQFDQRSPVSQALWTVVARSGAPDANSNVIDAAVAGNGAARVGMDSLSSDSVTDRLTALARKQPENGYEGWVIRWAPRGLASIASEQSFAALRELLGAGGNVREAALDAIEKSTNARGAGQCLLMLSESDADAQVGGALRSALARIDVDLRLRRLSDRDRDIVRDSVRTALMRIDPTRKEFSLAADVLTTVGTAEDRELLEWASTRCTLSDRARRRLEALR